MPDQSFQKLAEYREQIGSAILFSVVGISIGIGQLLASGEVLTARIIIGRALSTAGIAMSAGAVLTFFPQLSLLGQIGIAAALASLGTSGLERLFARIVGGQGKAS